METGSCFICGESVSFSSCPLCYKCAQAYKRAIIECMSDAKKEHDKIDNKIISEELGKGRYAEIVENYLSTERTVGSYSKIIPPSKIDKASRYLFNPERTSSIINELLYKGILMISENGDFKELSEEDAKAQRKENRTNAGRQIIREELNDMKRTLTNVSKDREEKIKNLGTGMFTNKYGGR